MKVALFLISIVKKNLKTCKNFKRPDKFPLCRIITLEEKPLEKKDRLEAKKIKNYPETREIEKEK